MCGNLLKTFKNCSNSLRSDSEQFLNNADSHAPRVTTPTANAPETKNISCLLASYGTAGLLLLTSFEVKECVFKTEIPLEIAISTITSNPADILRLKGKGKVEEGYDADLCILDQELRLVEVIAKGNTVYTK